VEHEVCSVGERAEEADVEVVAALIGCKWSFGSDLAMERVIGSIVP
jgi:hypothetical protein